MRKETKRNTKKGKTLVQVPNIIPFKQEILKEVQEIKKQKAEELERQRNQSIKIKQDSESAEKTVETIGDMVSVIHFFILK